MTIREKNAKIIKEILDKIGPDDAVIETENEWKLSVFYSEKNDDSLIIEMCLSIRIQGDPLFDPLMRIELPLDGEGKFKEALPLYYQSQTPFMNEELYSKGNPACWNPKLYAEDKELDRRLSSFLESLKIQGYLTRGKVVRE